MATMNFSGPDDVKDAFNREFAGRSKSAVIARLMRQAVFRELTAGRTDRPPLTEAQLYETREHGRP